METLEKVAEIRAIGNANLKAAQAHQKQIYDAKHKIFAFQVKSMKLPKLF